MVVDDKDPRIPDVDHTTAAVLAVSAGGATAPDLARVATAAAADGQEIVGILVANPDPEDQTSGRVPRLASPLRRPLPTRLHVVPMEINGERSEQMAWDAAFDGSLGERLADYEDPADLDARAAEPATGLVSLGFLWAALGRTVRLWCTLARPRPGHRRRVLRGAPTRLHGDDIPPAGGQLQPERHQRGADRTRPGAEPSGGHGRRPATRAAADSAELPRLLHRQHSHPDQRRRSSGSPPTGRRAARRSRSRRRSPSSSSPTAPPTSRLSSTC